MTGATRVDLRSAVRDLERRLTIRVGVMLVVAVGLLLTGIGTATTVILNRLPAAGAPAAAPHR